MSFRHPTQNELGIPFDKTVMQLVNYRFKRQFSRWPTLEDKEWLISSIKERQKEWRESSERLAKAAKGTPFVDYSYAAYNNSADDF